MKKIFIIALIASIIGCESDVNVDLPKADSAIAFDAWIYRKAEKQTITITQTNTYFDNTSPAGVSGASVNVVDEDGTVFTFNEEKPGTYSWIPANAADSFGTVGKAYFLDVNIDGKKYSATSFMGRVPEIDSITWRVPEDGSIKEDTLDPENTYLAEFWAQDIEGPGDAYWIKSWINGQYLNKPSEINISYDGVFSPGGDTDGTKFIQPIREAINSFDSEEEDKSKGAIPPFSKFGKDSIYVEINSITPEAWLFWIQVSTQTNRNGGFGELFAASPANVDSNIKAEGDSKVVGFFCVSAVSGLGRVFTKDALYEAPKE